MIDLQKKNKRIAFIVMAFFAAIYCSISLVNNYLFRTYALDLGLHIHAAYDYAHFRANYSMLLQPIYAPRNQLSDHFDLMVMLLSPLTWVFGQATLLLAQIGSILFGGYGIYKYFSSKARNSSLPLVAMFHFYSVWGIYSALSFDYHSSVIAAMMLPWFIYYFDKKNIPGSVLFFILIMISKEVMGLWLFFIGIGLCIHHFKTNRKLALRALYFSGAGMVYFLSMISYIIPSLAPQGSTYMHFAFDALGDTPGLAFKTVITSPMYVLRLLFESPMPDLFAIKPELHVYIVLSGGFALFLRPQFLVMLISIYAQKLFHNDPIKWGLNYHYCIEFVPVLSMALFSWINDLEGSRRQKLVGITVTVITFAATITSFYHRYSIYYSEAESSFLDMEHYRQSFDPAIVHQTIGKIPADASVSAGPSLVPHLALRDTIYCFPYTKNTDFIVLFSNGNSTFPLDQKSFFRSLEALKRDSVYSVVYNRNQLIIFQNKKYKKKVDFDL